MSTVVTEQQVQREALETVLKNNVLDRTSADHVNHGHGIASQMNPEQQLMIKRAKVAQQYYAGTMTALQGLSILNQANQDWQAQAHERTMRFAQTAKRKAVSETTKQDAQREAALQQGVAVGTISSEGTASISNSSSVANNIKVDMFVESQKQSAKQARTVGTSSNPIKGEQPNLELVSPYIKPYLQEKSFVGYSDQGKAIQGPPTPFYQVVTTGKHGGEKVRRFKSEESAQSFIQRKSKGGSENMVGPYGSLNYTYDEPRESSFGKLVEPAMFGLDEYQKSIAKNPILEPVINPLIGIAKAGLTSLTSLDNLGSQAATYLFGATPIKPTKTPDTFVGTVIQNTIEGKSQDTHIKDVLAYVRTYGVGGTIGELGEIGIGGGGKIITKAVPLRLKSYNQPGIKIFTSQTSKKIKSPDGTPQVITKQVTPKRLEFGYGSKTKPLISKVGDKITLGDVDLSKVSKVQVTQETGKQIQRGVKMAADSSKFEQIVAKKLIPKITGIDDASKEKAKVIEEIIDITTKPKKDTIISKSLPDNAFSGISNTEQKSVMGVLTNKQKSLLNPVGTYEGSLSQGFFVQPKYMRKFGDVDLHAPSYSKAAKQIKDITPKLSADPGRKFVDVISEKTQSAKTFIVDSKGNKEKIIEILNPEETDLSGVSQSIEGTTLFGKSIPKTVYKVDEGKTYGRQRQILKKGESLYSIQINGDKVSLGPAPFRKQKDTADFYALVESARVTEFAPGSKESIRLKELLTKFKGQQDFDVEKYLSKNRIKTNTPEKMEISIEKSTLQRLSTSKSLIQTSKSVGSSSSQLTKSIGSINPKSITRSINQKSTTRSITRSASRPSTVTKSLTPKKVKSPSIPKSSASMLSLGSSTGSSTGRSITGKSPSGRTGKIQTLRSVSSQGNNQTYPIPTTKARPLGAFILTKDKTDKAPGKRKPNHNFLGNTKVAEIGGFRTGKRDIDVGDKKTKKLYREDLLSTKKRYKKSDRQQTKNLLDNNRNSKMSLI